MDDIKTEIDWLEKKVLLSKLKVMQRESELIKAREALSSDEVDLKVAYYKQQRSEFPTMPNAPLSDERNAN